MKVRRTAAPTLFELIAATAANEHAIVLPHDSRRITYGELRNQVEAMAEALVAAGVRRGDRVAIALPNGLPMLVSLIAVSTVATAAPLNPAFKQDEFAFYLQDTAANALLLPPTGMEAAHRAINGHIRTLVVDMDTASGVTLTGVSGRRSIEPTMVDDVAIVLHTSGSTSRPKRVPLTHASLSISAAAIAETYRLGPDDVSLCVMPLFHVHGFVASALATFASGGAMVLPAKFNPILLRRQLREYEVTWYSAVPTMHQLALAVDQGVSQWQSSRLRFIRSCSAALSVRTMSALEDAFGVPVIEAYGMTEAAHQITSNPLPPGHSRPGSVGIATHVQITVMDANGRHLSPGERGEVAVKGPTVITSYDDHETTTASFVNGWFRTGDEGYLDADGYLTLTGRLKELISRGAEKISPYEIDEVLLAHPAVAEAVTFGVPHSTWGEEVAAAVVLREPTTEADLLAYCRDRLADFKCPKWIHITQDIPRTATGKVQRRVVAQVFGTAR